MPDAGGDRRQESGREGRALPHTGAYQDVMDYRILRLADGRSVARLEVEPRHLNQYAVAHGGVVLALLDVAGGLACYDLEREIAHMATVSMNTAFLAPVRPGPVVAVGLVERAGGSLAYTRMALHAESAEGPLLASAQGVYRLFGPRASDTRP